MTLKFLNERCSKGKTFEQRTWREDKTKRAFLTHGEAIGQYKIIQKQCQKARVRTKK